MARFLLSEELISKLTCPTGCTHREIFDSEVRGLYVDVLQSGRKSFRLRYRVRQRTHVVTLGDASAIDVDRARALAVEVLNKAKDRQANWGGADEVCGPTIQQFFDTQYLPFVKSYKKSWDTDESMIRMHILPVLGGQYLAALKASDVAVLVERMKSDHYAPGTINRALVLLRYGYTLAIRWGVLSVGNNPMKLFKNLNDDNRIEHFLTPQQAQALLLEVRKSENEMLQWIVLFLLYTGARKREVLDAKWADIDFTQKSWRIPKTKSGKVRHVPLSVHALEVLDSLRAKYGHQGFVFIFANPKTGLPYVSFFYSWNAARVRAGLGYMRVHDLRHSFASFLVNAGRSLYEVQEILGHSDIRTTSRYAHLSRERLQEAVEAVPHVK